MTQFETFCKRCGRKILMTRNEQNGRWVPCDPEIRRYRRGDGSFTYVNPEGQVFRGELVGRGFFDPNAEFGYQRHSADCAYVRRNAV